ncbi:hypothetical protein [Chryseobacterium sp. S90]|uniref:hypothetical protein n=1 Tax=Chryseobacterium sp. S90 TaxID=3395373 RepID=UPI0039BD5589
MKDYIKYLLPYKKSFQTINLSRREVVALEKLVINHLKVRDMSELRDKFEGQAFLDNFLYKSIPIIGIQKYLKNTFIDFENISVDKFLSEITISDQIVNVVMFGSNLPLIDIDNNHPCIFIHSTENSTLQLCGYASSQVIKDNLLNVKKYGFGSKETIKGNFYGFNHLLVFNSLCELESLIKA